MFPKEQTSTHFYKNTLKITMKNIISILKYYRYNYYKNDNNLPQCMKKSANFYIFHFLLYLFIHTLYFY